MSVKVDNIVTCDVCGRLFKEVRKRYYCEHCNKYFFVCPVCKENMSICTYCGIPLKKKSAPTVEFANT